MLENTQDPSTEKDKMSPKQIQYLSLARFGYGVNQVGLNLTSQIKTIEDAAFWLTQQVSKPYPLKKPLWTSDKALKGYFYYKQQENKIKQQMSAVPQPLNNTDAMPLASRRNMIEASRTLAQETALLGIQSEMAIQTRVLEFFSNHFAVSRTNLAVTILAPTLEAEAIAPNLHRTFGELLVDVVTHPAMILYLNNERSMGPNSRSVKRREQQKGQFDKGLNENLAREILELHTLGVDAAYTQKDVVEMAKAISGWSINNGKQGKDPGFTFRPYMHEPGARTIMGKHYPATKNLRSLRMQSDFANKHDSKALAQGYTILTDLAIHPATAQHISSKLAGFFISDTPSDALVNSMTKAWLSSKGNIPEVLSAMFQHVSSWDMSPRKYKTPRSFVLSACVACDIKKPTPSLFQTLEIMGQGLFNSGSPAGYPSNQEAWLGASSLNARIEWASHLASALVKRRKKIEPTKLAQEGLGPLLSEQSLQAIERAESKHQALALFLLSPEFQRT